MKPILMIVAVLLSGFLAFPSGADAYECNSSVRCFRDDLADGPGATCDSMGGFCRNRRCWCGESDPGICTLAQRCDDLGYTFSSSPGSSTVHINTCRGANTGGKGGVISYCFTKPAVLPPTGTITGISSPRSTELTSTGQPLGNITGTIAGGTGSGYAVETIVRRGDGTVCDDWTGAAWDASCASTSPAPTVVGGTWRLSGAGVPPLSEMTSGQTYRVYARFRDSSGKISAWVVSAPVLFQFVNDSQYISQSVPKTILTTNETMNVSVTMRNCRPDNDCSGLNTWTDPLYGIGSQNPQANTTWGLSTIQLPAGTSVPQGGTYTFPFTITAPAVAGSYNFQWRTLQQGFEWFGATSPNVVITVNVPVPPTVTNVAATIRDYCQYPAGADISWVYTGGSPQLKYQVQVADSRGFATPAYDSGIVTSSANTAYVTGLGASGIAPGIDWATTYRARVMVWDANDVPAVAFAPQTLCTGSGCAGNAWTTPAGAYPIPDFTYVPAQPLAGQAVQFTDTSVCSGVGCTQWSWDFGDGSSDTVQHPSHVFPTESAYTVTLQATDANANTCSVQKDLNSSKAIPFWKEVLSW